MQDTQQHITPSGNRRWRQVGRWVGVALALTGVHVGTALAQTCQETVVRTRTLEVWYGTLTIRDTNGAVVSTTDFVELDKRISVTLGFAITHDPTVDQRLRTGDGDSGALSPWVTNQSGIEWVLDPTPGTDAHAALLADYTTGGPRPVPVRSPSALQAPLLPNT